MDREKEKIVNEIREKLDGINGSLDFTEPTYVQEDTDAGKIRRVLSISMDADRTIWFTLESEETGRYGCNHGWISTKSLRKISKIIPTKWAVVRFHTPYGGCDLDWFVSREAIPANNHSRGELGNYLYKNYPALRWSSSGECEFAAFPEEEEDSGAYFIATVED